MEHPTPYSLRKEILDKSYELGLGHIPSAFSFVDALYGLTKYIDFDNDGFVIGKPFGAQAYCAAWKDYGFSYEEDVPMTRSGLVDFADETLGNAIGVAIGLALSKKYRKVWCFVSDASLMEGSSLEAIQTIDRLGITPDLLHIVVDDNSRSMRSDKVDKSIPLVLNRGEEVVATNLGSMLLVRRYVTPRFNSYENPWFNTSIAALQEATIGMYQSTKGRGIKFMEDDPQKYHYKVMDEELYNQSVQALKEYYGVEE